MKMSPLSERGRKRGFTLVELLVAITILSLLLVVLAGAMGAVINIWRAGIGTVDNYTKARVVLNLLDRDVQMMVMRRDLSAFVDGTGNTACAFYTNVPGNQGQTTNDTRALSLVQYKLSTTTTTSALQRLARGLNFPSTSGTPTPITMTISNLTQLTDLANVSATTQTDTLYTGIIRFQIQFVDGTGNMKTAFSYSYPQPSLSTNSRAAIVSMAVLSNPAYTIASQSATTMASLATDLPNTLPSGSSNLTFSQYWNSVVNPSSGTFDTTLPAPVRTGIQVFERHVPLPVTTPSS